MGCVQLVGVNVFSFLPNMITFHSNLFSYFLSLFIFGEICSVRKGRGQRGESRRGGWEELVGVSCQGWFGRAWSGACYWVPACAGMTFLGAAGSPIRQAQGRLSEDAGMTKGTRG